MVPAESLAKELLAHFSRLHELSEALMAKGESVAVAELATAAGASDPSRLSSPIPDALHWALLEASIITDLARPMIIELYQDDSDERWHVQFQVDGKRISLDEFTWEDMEADIGYQGMITLASTIRSCDAVALDKAFDRENDHQDEKVVQQNIDAIIRFARACLEMRYCPRYMPKGETFVGRLALIPAAMRTPPGPTMLAP